MNKQLTQIIDTKQRLELESEVLRKSIDSLSREYYKEFIKTNPKYVSVWTKNSANAESYDEDRDFRKGVFCYGSELGVNRVADKINAYGDVIMQSYTYADYSLLKELLSLPHRLVKFVGLDIYDETAELKLILSMIDILSMNNVVSEIFGTSNTLKMVVTPIGYFKT